MVKKINKQKIYVVLNYSKDYKEMQIVWKYPEGTPHYFMTDKEGNDWAKENLVENYKIIEL